VVAKGEVVEASFKLINEGTGTLNVKTVRPTCGCTVADYPKEVAAGSEGAIVAKLDTAEFSGPISKALLLMTDDPETPTMSLVLKAMVQPFIQVLPKPLVRINSIQTEVATQKVYMVADPKVTKSFKVVTADSEVPYIKVASRRLDDNEKVEATSGDQYEITLTLTEDAPPGPINTQVVIHTDHDKAKKVPIKVYGVVRALIHVTPPSVQFGSVEAQMKPGRNIVVVNNRPQSALEITSAEVDDPAFATDVATIKEGQRFQVAVTIKPDATPGPRDATLRLRTNDAQFSEITVPVRAAIK
jgi:hypothetical protein